MYIENYTSHTVLVGVLSCNLYSFHCRRRTAKIWSKWLILILPKRIRRRTIGNPTHYNVGLYIYMTVWHHRCVSFTSPLLKPIKHIVYYIEKCNLLRYGCVSKKIITLWPRPQNQLLIRVHIISFITKY